MAGDPTVEDCEDDGSHAVPAMVAALAARIDAERALLRDGEEEEAARVPIPSCPGSLDNLPAGEAVDVDSMRVWDGESSINALEACNGVTKCRGVLLRPKRRVRLHSFTFSLRLSRGKCVGFKPIVCEWLSDIEKATDILFTGEPQLIQAETFEEYTCTIPDDVTIEAGPDRPLVLGFWSEPCTEHRSASAELGQVPAYVLEETIAASLYLNGKMLSGTWRTYTTETLACRVNLTPL